MALVGPRPERPELVAEIARKLPFYEPRHLVRPGITGSAQVYAPYAASVEETLEKLSYDLYYVKHRSFATDAGSCSARWASWPADVGPASCK